MRDATNAEIANLAKRKGTLAGRVEKEWKKKADWFSVPVPVEPSW